MCYSHTDLSPGCVLWGGPWTSSSFSHLLEASRVHQTLSDCRFWKDPVTLLLTLPGTLHQQSCQYKDQWEILLLLRISWNSLILSFSLNSHGQDTVQSAQGTAHSCLKSQAADLNRGYKTSNSLSAMVWGQLCQPRSLSSDQAGSHLTLMQNILSFLFLK